MTTVVNNPAPTTDSSGGIGFLMGAILIVGFVAILLYFGIPAIRRMGQVQVNVPAPQVNIPSKLDVNVTQK